MKNFIIFLFVAIVAAFVPVESDYSLAFLIGTAAASTTTTFNLTKIPQFITFIATSTPTLIRLEVDIVGTVLNLDDVGIVLENNLLSKGQVTNGFTIQAADGEIGTRNITNATLTITNAVAGTVDVRGYSLRTGGLYTQTVQQTVLANSGQVFSDFTYLGLGGFNDSDQLQVTYRNGHVETSLTSTELQSAIQTVQNNLVNAIPNFDQTVRKVDYTPIANRTIFQKRIIPVGIPANPVANA